MNNSGAVAPDSKPTKRQRIRGRDALQQLTADLRNLRTFGVACHLGEGGCLLPSQRADLTWDVENERCVVFMNVKNESD